MNRLAIVFALLLALAACKRSREPVILPPPPPRVPVKVARRPLTDQVRLAIDKLEQEAHRLNLAGKADEAVKRQERILYHYRAFGQRLEAGRMSMIVGFHYGNHGFPARGAGHIIAAYKAGREAGSPAGETLRRQALEALHNLALNFAEKGEEENALQCYGPLIEYLERTEPRARAELGQAYHNQAWVESDCGNYEAAAETYGKALALRLEAGTPYDVAWSLNNLGHTWLKAGNFEQAAANLYRALAEVRKGGFRDIQDKVLDNLELVSVKAAEAGRRKLALANDERLMKEAEEYMPPYRVRRILYRIVDTARKSSRIEKALEASVRLARKERDWDNPFGRGRAMHATAETLARSDREERVETAAVELKAALALQRRIGDRLGEAASLILRSELEAPERASATLDRVESIYRETGEYRPGVVALLRARAAVAGRAGKEEEAAAFRKKADALDARPPLGDLPRISVVERIAERGKALASMKPGDAVIVVTRGTDGWLFRDEPSGVTRRVELRYRNRPVNFQGFLFHVFAKTVRSGGLSFFLRPHERLVQTKDGRLYRAKR